MGKSHVIHKLSTLLKYFYFLPISLIFDTKDYFFYIIRYFLFGYSVVTFNKSIFISMFLLCSKFSKQKISENSLFNALK